MAPGGAWLRLAVCRRSSHERPSPALAGAEPEGEARPPGDGARWVAGASWEGNHWERAAARDAYYGGARAARSA